MTVYVLVRVAYDDEFNLVDVFNGVFATRQQARTAKLKMEEDFPDEDYSIVTREIKEDPKEKEVHEQKTSTD